MGKLCGAGFSIADFEWGWMDGVIARFAWGRWRLPAMSVAVLLIVVLPSLLLHYLTTESLEAADAVGHTHEVEAALGQVAMTVREMESAGMVITLGADLAPARERILSGRQELPEQMAELSRLTADNPKQQLLLGRLQELINNRLDVIDQMIIADPESFASLATALVTRFPIRGVIQEMLQNERALLAERYQDSKRQRTQTIWLRWGALLVQLLLLGLVTYLLGRQVAQRLAAEQKSRKASDRAVAVLQTVREPIVLLDGELHVLMHNTAFAELYGLELTARTISLEDIGDGAWDDPVLRQRLGDVLARGRELWDFEYEHETADGMIRTVLLNARRMPLPDSDDHVVLMTVSDISVQKATQLRIAELNRQLEGKVDQVSEVNRELEAFSYSVSHDLRAPLRHVAGFSDKLTRHLGDTADEKSRHYLDVIGNSARRMSQLIDDLLVYSRLGRSALRLQAVDMQTLVAETRAMLDSSASADGAATRVEWRIAPLPILVADENMMRQLWSNLLSNAVKYSSRREHAIIEVVHQTQPDGSHHFLVRDNGAGFDMSYATKLFGVFQRLHKAADYPGTGIGLASVRRVLSRHGGRIWAESAPDQGATFHFTLPSALDASSSNERSP
jgi:PAS domain S-box-containing protein